MHPLLALASHPVHQRIRPQVGRLSNYWDNIRHGLWFVPTLLVVGAFILALGMIEVDRRLALDESPLQPLLFGGTADAARSLLSTIAGSLVTVISIAFSMTLVALQQVSVQFSPRVLDRLTGNRTNQFVVGMYIATFTFALLVLRSIRSAEEDPATRFIPALSITVALILSLFCLALLIYFIHHISQALQVGTLMDEIHSDLINHIDTLYPSSIGDAITRASSPHEPGHPVMATAPKRLIRSQHSGFLRKVDEDALLNGSLQAVRWLAVRPQVGDFVAHGAVLAEIDNAPSHDEKLDRVIEAAFILDRTRSIEQDPLFGVRQLVDIALKALSPSINDPTTAELALSYLGNALGHLAKREFPSSIRTPDHGDTVLIFNRPTWDDFVEASFNQIRRHAGDDVQVTGRLLSVLAHLALQVSIVERYHPLQHQVSEIAATLADRPFSAADKAALHKQIEAIRGFLVVDALGGPGEL